MSEKIIIDGLDGFRQREGQHLFSSEPFEISKQRIQEFCRSIGNDEWIHWDEERLAKSPLGGIIMPSSFCIKPLIRIKFWSDMTTEFKLEQHVSFIITS